MNPYKEEADKIVASGKIDKSALVDITGIDISGDDIAQRAQVFFNAIGNPYLFRVGDIAVNIVYSSTTNTLQDGICNLLGN